MTFIINKTDGTLLVSLGDGIIDTTSSPLTLIGRGTQIYGEDFAENAIHILENFAHTSPPNNPLQGQLWYDTNTSRLKLREGSQFNKVGNVSTDVVNVFTEEQHIQTGSAGATAHVNADDLVVEFGGVGGISILNNAAQAGNLYFGDNDDNDVGQIHYNHAADFMQFTVNASERMRIDSAGNVGIGITNPRHLLSLNKTGGAYIDIVGGNPSSTIKFGSQGNGAVIYSSNIIDFYSGATTPHVTDGNAPNSAFRRMHFTASGNIGIGTIIPTNPLVVESTNGDYTSNLEGSGVMEIRTPLNNLTDDALLNFHLPGQIGIHVGLDNSDNLFKIGGFSFPDDVFSIDPATGNIGIGRAPSNVAGQALHIQRTDDGNSVAPLIVIDRKSASPAVFDQIGEFRFIGNTSTGAVDNYSGTRGTIIDPTNGTTDGRLDFFTTVNGTYTSRAFVQDGMFMKGATGSDKGAGTFNTAGLYVNGVQFQPDVQNTFSANQFFTSLDDDGSGNPVVTLYADSISPAPNDILAIMDYDYNNSIDTKKTGVQIYGVLLDPTNGTEDVSFKINTTVAGVLNQRLAVEEGLVMFTATGGDQGAGTINATAVFDDGALLTPYVLEAANTGDINIAQLDQTVPNRTNELGEVTEERIHEPARRFKENMSSELDPKHFADHWKTKGHLPAFPSENDWIEAKGKIGLGDLVQRLMETVECQAVHIDKLLQRIETLEDEKQPAGTITTLHIEDSPKKVQNG